MSNRAYKRYPAYMDSGVEWLGEIPVHWEVMRLKEIVAKITVGIIVNPSKYCVDDGVPCLRSLSIAEAW